MPVYRFVFVIAVCCAASACSKDAWKRTGYETLQNVNDQQCDKDFASDCPQRQSYDSYQREKQSVENRPD